MSTDQKVKPEPVFDDGFSEWSDHGRTFKGGLGGALLIVTAALFGLAATLFILGWTVAGVLLRTGII